MADNMVMNNNPQPAATPPVSKKVCQWAIFNALVFVAMNIARLIVNSIPCTKSTWVFWCVALTHDVAAAEELSFLPYGELAYSATAALAALLHLLLTTRTTVTSCWAAAVVDILAWVALAGTARVHCLELASDRIVLATDPGDKYIFADVVFCSLCLSVDLLAGFLLCCSPPHSLEVAEHHQGDEVSST